MLFPSLNFPCTYTCLREAKTWTWTTGSSSSSRHRRHASSRWWTRMGSKSCSGKGGAAARGAELCPRLLFVRCRTLTAPTCPYSVNHYTLLRFRALLPYHVLSQTALKLHSWSGENWEQVKRNEIKQKGKEVATIQPRTRRSKQGGERRKRPRGINHPRHVSIKHHSFVRKSSPCCR